MMQRVIGLLFFAFLCVGTVPAEDYVFLKGDSLSSVAQKKKVPTEVLLRANPGTDGGKVRAGDTLIIPDRYTVKPGDTLYSLCRRWGVEQSAVGALNHWPADFVLKKGQVIFLPGSSAAGKSGPAVSATKAGFFWPVDRVPHAEGDKLKSVTFATSGEAFHSVSAGAVVYLGEFRGVGRVLLVQGPDKTVFAYGNFEESQVEFGQTVTKGQTLGLTSPRSSQKLTFFASLQSEPLDVFSAKR